MVAMQFFILADRLWWECNAEVEKRYNVNYIIVILPEVSIIPQEQKLLVV